MKLEPPVRDKLVGGVGPFLREDGWQGRFGTTKGTSEPQARLVPGMNTARVERARGQLPKSPLSPPPLPISFCVLRAAFRRGAKNSLRTEPVAADFEDGDLYHHLNTDRAFEVREQAYLRRIGVRRAAHSGRRVEGGAGWGDSGDGGGRAYGRGRTRRD